MRKRRIFLMVSGVVIAPVLGTLLMRSPRPEAGALRIGFSVLGYTNQPGQWEAQVLLTNEGPAVVCYNGVGLSPCGWIKAEIPGGWTNCPLTSSPGSTFALPPGGSVSFTATLPPGTLRYEAASIRAPREPTPSTGELWLHQTENGSRL